MANDRQNRNQGDSKASSNQNNTYFYFETVPSATNDKFQPGSSGYIRRREDAIQMTQYKMVTTVALGDWPDLKELIQDYPNQKDELDPMKKGRGCKSQFIVLATPVQVKDFLDGKFPDGIGDFFIRYETDEQLFIIEAHGGEKIGDLYGWKDNHSINRELKVTPEQLADFIIRSCPNLTHLKIKNLACFAAVSDFNERFLKRLCSNTSHNIKEVTIIGAIGSAKVGRELGTNNPVEDNAERTLLHFEIDRRPELVDSSPSALADKIDIVVLKKQIDDFICMMNSLRDQQRKEVREIERHKRKYQDENPSFNYELPLYVEITNRFREFVCSKTQVPTLALRAALIMIISNMEGKPVALAKDILQSIGQALQKTEIIKIYAKQLEQNSVERVWKYIKKNIETLLAKESNKHNEKLKVVVAKIFDPNNQNHEISDSSDLEILKMAGLNEGSLNYFRALIVTSKILKDVSMTDQDLQFLRTLRNTYPEKSPTQELLNRLIDSMGESPIASHSAADSKDVLPSTKQVSQKTQMQLCAKEIEQKLLESFWKYAKKGIESLQEKDSTSYNESLTTVLNRILHPDNETHGVSDSADLEILKAAGLKESLLNYFRAIDITSRVLNNTSMTDQDLQFLRTFRDVYPDGSPTKTLLVKLIDSISVLPIASHSSADSKTTMNAVVAKPQQEVLPKFASGQAGFWSKINTLESMSHSNQIELIEEIVLCAIGGRKLKISPDSKSEIQSKMEEINWAKVKFIGDYEKLSDFTDDISRKARLTQESNADLALTNSVQIQQSDSNPKVSVTISNEHLFLMQLKTILESDALCKGTAFDHEKNPKQCKIALELINKISDKKYPTLRMTLG